MGYCFTRDAMLMVLCDGLGGHSLGEVAAQQALQTLARQFQHWERDVRSILYQVANPR